MADENQQPTAENAPAQDNGDLTINDLNAMKQIIDVASARGAFKPGEMVAVGQTYNKLATFLENIAKQTQQNAPATAPAQGA
jgi:hypothetical protein